MISGEMRQVLVVEDDDAIREAVRDVLVDAGYVVFAAPNGRYALERLSESGQGMVVLLDANMPSMDGIEMLQAVAGHKFLAMQHVYVLVTAFFDNLPAQGMGLVQNLNIPILHKPFDIDDLLAAVRNAQRVLDARAIGTPDAIHILSETDL